MRGADNPRTVEIVRGLLPTDVIPSNPEMIPLRGRSNVELLAVEVNILFAFPLRLAKLVEPNDE